MATTLAPEHEAEFENRWCRKGESADEISDWLWTLGVRVDVEKYAARHALYRPWSTNPAAIADRKAIQDWLSSPTRPPDNPVRKPTPEERAARRVPLGGYRMGVGV